MDQNKSKIGKFLSFRLEKEELKNQLENYDTLAINKAYRKIAALIISVIAALSIVAVKYDESVEVPFYVMVLSTAIYFLVAFFVSNGNRFAIMLSMVVWTVGKGTQLFHIADLASVFIIITFWFLIVRVFWRAFEVETARRKSRE